MALSEQNHSPVAGVWRIIGLLEAVVITEIMGGFLVFKIVFPFFAHGNA